MSGIITLRIGIEWRWMDSQPPNLSDIQKFECQTLPNWHLAQHNESGGHASWQTHCPVCPSELCEPLWHINQTWKEGCENLSFTASWSELQVTAWACDRSLKGLRVESSLVRLSPQPVESDAVSGRTVSEQNWLPAPSGCSENCLLKALGTPPWGWKLSLRIQFSDLTLSPFSNEEPN